MLRAGWPAQGAGEQHHRAEGSSPRAWDRAGVPGSWPWVLERWGRRCSQRGERAGGLCSPEPQVGDRGGSGLPSPCELGFCSLGKCWCPSLPSRAHGGQFTAYGGASSSPQLLSGGSSCCGLCSGASCLPLWGQGVGAALGPLGSTCSGVQCLLFLTGGGRKCPHALPALSSPGCPTPSPSPASSFRAEHHPGLVWPGRTQFSLADPCVLLAPTCDRSWPWPSSLGLSREVPASSWQNCASWGWSCCGRSRAL